MMKVLPLSYYQHHDVLFMGKDLLGKVLCTSLHGQIVKAIITETESYKGPEDKASHAYQGRRTKRNEVMYAVGGKAYVYICYGMHNLFNIVTGPEESPHAVLIRAVLPIFGFDVIQARRGKKEKIIIGPGKVSQALGIDKSLNGMELTSDMIWLEDHHIKVPKKEIECLKRVGIDYAEEHALLDWRFRIKNIFVGKLKLGYTYALPRGLQ